MENQEFLGKYDEGLVGVKLRCMKEIGPPPRKYRMQGYLRINTIYTKRVTGFTFDYPNYNRLSIFLLHVSLSLGKAMQSTQARLKREAILDQILSAPNLLDGKEGRDLNSFQNIMAFCISVERISGDNLSPIEGFKSKVFCLLFHARV